MRVLEGAVREVRYGAKASDGSLPVVGDGTLEAGQVTFMHDVMGFHKVGNPSPHTPAVSLHLYSPPFSTCRVWMDADRPADVLHPVVTYFSEYGELVDYAGAPERR